MKLLFDNNLSQRLVERLSEVFPDSSHVRLQGLQRANDDAIWRHAGTHGYVIATKDADFNERTTIYGFPPKVIWLRIGNCTTAEVETALRANRDVILEFAEDAERSLLTLL